MKKLISFLLILCLLLGCGSIAFAASKPSISSQPESQTVKAGGSVTFRIKAKNFTALTWYFVNPENGEKTSARHISEKFKGLKVQSPNGQSLTLKKVPEGIHGWSLYCHLVGNGYQLDSDTVMIQIEGMGSPEDTSAPAPEESGTNQPEEGSTVQNEESPSETEVPSEGTEEASSEPVKPFTVTAIGELQLYELSRSGKPAGDPKSALSFEDEASFFVKANGYIQYLLINDIQLTPSGNVSGITIRGITKDTTIQGRVIKPKNDSDTVSSTESENEEFDLNAEEEATTEIPENTADELPENSTEDNPAEEIPENSAEDNPAEEIPENSAEDNPAEEIPENSAEDNPAEEIPENNEAADDPEDTYEITYVSPVTPTPAPEVPADTSNMVFVSCERCRFSGGGNSFATSGYVPVGTTITVVCGSEGNLAAGYSINGAAGSNKGQASFKLTVEADTTISMQKR